MANIKLIELRPVENPIEDLSYKVTDTIFGGTCEGDDYDRDYRAIYYKDGEFYVRYGGNEYVVNLCEFFEKYEVVCA